MLKFIRNYADKINHVEIFPLIGLFIFVGFFIVMLIYVKKMSRKDIHELSQLPLDLENENNTGKNNPSAIPHSRDIFRNPQSAIHI